MRPPMIVDSLVRWQLSTVPARVLAIDDSTVPRWTSVTTTGIGFGRVNQYTARAMTRTTASASPTRRSVVAVLGFIQGRKGGARRQISPPAMSAIPVRSRQPAEPGRRFAP